MSQRRTKDERYCYRTQATFSESQWFAINSAAVAEKIPVTQVIRRAVVAYLRQLEEEEKAAERKGA